MLQSRPRLRSRPIQTSNRLSGTLSRRMFPMTWNSRQSSPMCGHLFLSFLLDSQQSKFLARTKRWLS